MSFVRRILHPTLTALVCIIAMLVLQPVAEAESPNEQSVRVRFVDSATGRAVVPDSVEAQPQEAGRAGRRLHRDNIETEGRAEFVLDNGTHTLSVSAAGYKPMSGTFTVSPENHFNIELQLDPLDVPREISPEHVASLHRVNETVFVGHVVDDDSGETLAGVSVRAEPSGNETLTDARGYFQIYVPVQTLTEATNAPASLVFSRYEFRTEERQYLELSSQGDGVYRIRLERGADKIIVDERLLRRRSAYPVSVREEFPPPAELPPSLIQPEATTIESFMAQAVVDGGISTQQLASTTAHVRIPTNIRVLRQDNVTIDYISLQTYGQRSLPSEWIASWGSVGPGNSGTNSLNAGAVANRTYAVGYVNNPASANYDICASTSCPVYNHAFTDSRTTTAVNFTANYVMFQPGTGRVGFKITEYSAENNQLGMACGDGFTAPTGGCLFDPVCMGENEFGHGRGMCQWGSARWASGRKMAGRVTGDTTTNNFPLQNWIWICEHYYPDLVLAQGAPLAIGDDVKVLGTVSLSVRQCPGNTITNGALCAQVASKPTDSIGTIIGGPMLVSVDGVGHTWWQVNWGDTNGWSVENYLERVSATPGTPGTLTATAISSSQINLAWADNAANEIGTYIERGPAAGGPWTANAFVRAGITNFADTGLVPGTTNYYRVRTFNQSAVSAYSNTTNAVTPGLPPVLAAISNRTVVENALLTFTNTATATDFVTELSDFENYSAGTAVMFRLPNFSGSTSAHLSNSPNVAAVSSTIPTGNGSARVLNVNWAFTNSAPNPWLRLTTFNSTTLPNPVIDFTRRLRFRIWTDKPLQVGLGLRETTTASGTPIGSDGGTTGDIEWVGVTNSISGQPQPTRLIAASNWTTLEFNLPAEPVRSFASGNGILSTASGLGTLEHIAFVPMAGNVAYNVYLDDFDMFSPNALTYSLSNNPAGATVGSSSGVFNWTPSEAQGPGVYPITVIVTDNNVPPQSDSETFSVTVTETNAAPILTLPPSQNVVELSSFIATNSASDTDLPANTLAFGLVSGPVGLTLNTNSGVMTWTPTEAQGPGTYPVTVFVSDNGTPPLSFTNNFTLTVLESNSPPTLAAISDRTVHAGTFISFTNSGTDPDLPANALTYSIFGTPPEGASVNATNGIFTWQTGDANANTTNTINVRLADHEGILSSDSRSFAVAIFPRPLIQQIELSDTNVVLTWSAINGTSYRVQSKTNIEDVLWTDLTPDVNATGTNALRSEPLGFSQRFYRVRVLTP
ncbi:MAG: hypothetical protein HOP33_03485 [Verrucomicrobia bacterium]|nr:hypothetical protein [Verrucomicrobiota bacterium]